MMIVVVLTLTDIESNNGKGDCDSRIVRMSLFTYLFCQSSCSLARLPVLPTDVHASCNSLMKHCSALDRSMRFVSGSFPSAPPLSIYHRSLYLLSLSPVLLTYLDILKISRYLCMSHVLSSHIHLSGTAYLHTYLPYPSSQHRNNPSRTFSSLLFSSTKTSPNSNLTPDFLELPYHKASLARLSENSLDRIRSGLASSIFLSSSSSSPPPLKATNPDRQHTK
ncbi:hypothetical protein GGR53DRAFT_228415 [Hypoxylon sp. FL1150]|nr:hypothetical protein GGR53DRAFT_228415 [Hypoxylon sp. FL1150]